MAAVRFSEKDLYRGPARRPRAHDIRQDRLNDCYLLAPLGALAELQPERIQRAIAYDRASACFLVTLYRNRGGRAEAVAQAVGQEALADNLRRGGGSTVDNALWGWRDAPIWPAVIETAYACLHDSDLSDGLDEGYARIDWGYPHNAMYALTGEYGEHLEPALARELGAAGFAAHLQQALAQGRPVTLGTQAECGALQDGLQDGHAFMVLAVDRAEDGRALLRLRNPLGHNRHGREGRDHGQAITHACVAEMLARGGLWGVNIGPPPQSPVVAGASEPAA